MLGVTPFWVYDATNALHADYPGLYSSAKVIIICTIDEIHLRCDVIDRSVVNGLRHQILFHFVLDKPLEKKFLWTWNNTLKNKSILNSITFYLEDDDFKEGNFNGGLLYN